MKKNLTLLTTTLIFFFCSNAQTITGQLRDPQTNNSLPGITVTLQSIKDTSYSTFTSTDKNGHFVLSQLRRDSFRVSFSSVGYEHLSRIVFLNRDSLDLGRIDLPRASKELATVTVTSSTPPVVQKGDTVQFNASSFKVNPDASAEDLARKIPGITIENGQVKANGDVVQKVTIDGRELFGDDATAALRNLPAEVIDKIQVFDRLSDQAQFTGFDDGSTTKGINIITKANMRNGQFGRVFAGYGTDDRYTAGGNASIYRENRRISLVGNFNNINQQNFSQQDLLGVTSSSQRGGSRGGGGGGNRGQGGNRGSTGGGGQGGNASFGNSSTFLVGQQNGINQTNAVGINYSDMWGKKLTVTGSYFFNNTENNTNQITHTQYFTNAYNSLDTTLSDSRNNNHRVNLRLEYKIDSSNQLIFTPSLSFQDNNTTRTTKRETFYDTTGSSLLKSNFNNASMSNRSGDNINNSILYRHSFAKRGRTFSVNVNTSYNERTGGTYVNTFQHSMYTSGSLADTTSKRFTDPQNNGWQVSSNFIYTEPVGKSGQVQLNYNPTISKSNGDQAAYGFNQGDNIYNVPLDSLSNKINNKTTSQNAGLSYRYGTKDKQLSFGVNYQHTDLNSNQTLPQPFVVNRGFDNILPNAMIRYKFSTKSSMRLFYREAVTTPSITQLQGVVDLTNAPLYSTGNPELNPQFTHTVSSQYTYTNTPKSILFMGNVYFQAATNYIGNATFIRSRDTVVNGQTIGNGAQLSKPVNLNGYRNFRSYLTFAVPVKPIKSNINLNGGFTFSQLPGMLDYVASLTKSYTYTLGTVIGSNISQYVDFTLSYSANYNQINSPAQKSQPAQSTHYFQHTAGLQANLLSKKGWFFQNDLTNQYYNGLTANLNQNYFLWNMGVGKKFLKNNKGELKLSVFDVLGQNQSITRNVTETYIEDVRNVVLQRYFMLSFTYNLKNFGTPPKSGGRSGSFGGGRK